MVPTPFVEKFSLHPLNYLGTFTKNLQTIYYKDVFLDSILVRELYD